MRWVINTLISVTFFIISIAVLLLVFNSFMTIAVAETNHALDTAISESQSPGVAIDVSETGDGLVISTQDGSMTLTGNGIEY